MLKFVKLNQETPEKRKISDRKGDFHEIYNEYIIEKAKDQSKRCSWCGVPFCQVYCLLHINIPDQNWQQRETQEATKFPKHK